MGIEEWYIDESKKSRTKEVTAKSESTSGVKFGNMDSDFTTMTSRIQSRKMTHGDTYAVIPFRNYI